MSLAFDGRVLKVDEKLFDFLYGVYGEMLLDQLKHADAWLVANPARHKRNYKRFLINWLNKETRMIALAERKREETARELHVGTGPQAYVCAFCRKRLVAAFLPASCPGCGRVKTFERSD